MSVVRPLPTQPACHLRNPLRERNGRSTAMAALVRGAHRLRTTQPGGRLGTTKSKGFIEVVQDRAAKVSLATRLTRSSETS